MTWKALRPEDALDLMRGYGRPWWVAGGWALDLFLGATTREHSDLDLAVLRDDQEHLYLHFAGWELHVAHRGELRPWEGERLELPFHELWARPAGSPVWHLELLLLESADGRWLFRRDPRVRLALERIGLVRDGIPYLAPEIPLLYKAKEPRAHDEADLAAVLPHLPNDRRRRLADAVRSRDASHPWLERLDGNL